MRLFGVWFLAVLMLPVRSDAEGLPTFPGAEGAGAMTPGGRGGRVLFVTSLQDSGPGTLREALEAEGPRIVLFRVTGNIELKSRLVIANPFITVAGQTSPGGICIAGGTLEVATHDVVLRYLRIRPGDVQGEQIDALVIEGQNVVVDHCSLSWGIDETLSITDGAKDVTVQWSIVAEGLTARRRIGGNNGNGILLNSDGDITLHHNLFAFHRSRTPRIVTGRIDFRNNAIYGWEGVPGHSEGRELEMNYVANYLRPGPFTQVRNRAFRAGAPTQRFYVAHNRMAGEPEVSLDNWLLFEPPGEIAPEDFRKNAESLEPLPFPPVAMTSAELAYRQVLDQAGASYPERDSADRRIVLAIKQMRGQILDSQEKVGGWPRLRGGDPPPDTDGDGMPDDWEAAMGLDPNNAEDAALDRDGDGYTNIEEYINSIVVRIAKTSD